MSRSPLYLSHPYVRLEKVHRLLEAGSSSLHTCCSLLFYPPPPSFMLHHCIWMKLLEKNLKRLV
uniref:Uncharacterized protein n=1 Tax=Utricularia reniformis TaxID=192314 RepID=A0A1Y0B2R5_9LAMI|nr:hypothetical protein AEK19_MT1493 [Utricularia reniformis]ART31684.1 hypothetical protein AEK19_MT1493 [Utricularia reniformis]